MKSKLIILLASCFALVVFCLSGCFLAKPDENRVPLSSVASQQSLSSKAAENAASDTEEQQEELAPSEQTPYTVDENGDISQTDGEAADDEGGPIVRIDATTQQVQYSLDGGKTWTTQKPAELQ